MTILGRIFGVSILNRQKLVQRCLQESELCSLTYMKFNNAILLFSRAQMLHSHFYLLQDMELFLSLHIQVYLL